MKKFWIEIHFEVDARDYDEAVDIAKEAVEVTKTMTGYKVRDVEASQIEEV